jgi:transposase
VEANRTAVAAGARSRLRPAQDNRRYFEGMMWIARTGAQRRHLSDEYGKWNSVFWRYRRWATGAVRLYKNKESNIEL